MTSTDANETTESTTESTTETEFTFEARFTVGEHGRHASFTTRYDGDRDVLERAAREVDVRVEFVDGTGDAEAAEAAEATVDTIRVSGNPSYVVEALHRYAQLAVENRAYRVTAAQLGI